MTAVPDGLDGLDPDDFRVTVYGRIVGGEGLRVQTGAAPGHLAVNGKGTLELGRDVVIGPGAGIAVLDHLSIGDDTVIGANVAIADSSFHEVGDMKAKPTPQPIHIGARVHLGAWTVVMPGAWIGDDVEVAPFSVVGGIIGDGRRVAGNPAVEQVEAGGGGALDVIVATLEAPGLDPDAALTTLDQWDSLMALRLLTTLERAFGLTLDDEVAGACRTAGEWARLVETARGVAAR